MTSLHSEGALWARAQFLRFAVMRLADLAAAQGVRLLAVKGVHLIHELGLDPRLRPLADADVLLANGEATERLIADAAQQNFSELLPRGVTDRNLRSAEGCIVDVHSGTLLPFCLGTLTAADLFGRAQPSKQLGQALVPDAADAACIAIANALKDGLAKPLALDLDALLTRGELSPVALAERLRERTLRRAALVALEDLCSQDARWIPLLEALGPTRRERSWALTFAQALRWAARSKPRMLLALAPLGLDGSIKPVAAAAVGLGRILRLGVRDVRNVRRRGHSSNSSGEE